MSTLISTDVLKYLDNLVKAYDRKLKSISLHYTMVETGTNAQYSLTIRTTDEAHTIQLWKGEDRCALKGDNPFNLFVVSCQLAPCQQWTSLYPYQGEWVIKLPTKYTITSTDSRTVWFHNDSKLDQKMIQIHKISFD